MSELFKSIECLPKIGKKRLEKYNKLNIYTPYDLLCYYPRNYIDYSNPVPIYSSQIGHKYAVKGTVIEKILISTGKFMIYKSLIEESETHNYFYVTIFNNVYAHESLIKGCEYIFYGKVSLGYEYLEITSPTVIPSNEPTKLQPIYHLTSGLTNAMIYTNLKQCLEIFDQSPFETLNQDILSNNDLISFQKAIHSIHFPSSIEDIKMARKRLAFEELLLLQLGMATIRNTERNHTGCTMARTNIDEFFAQLPFDMTNGQMNAINDIIQDMCKDTPMNRLIQGDVGSGKTAVSIASCYYAYKNGFQSAIMAPTEILAQQHYQTYVNILQPLGVRVGLLTGSLTVKQKKLIRQQIEDGELDVIAGTHALIQKDTIFKSLGLVITDEQHRFGVSQRSKLSNKGNYPHKLVMSATPIPRTLGLIIYGDLDISTIKELPKGRQPIDTFAVSGKLRQRAFNYIIKELLQGGQAYIVCPMIEDNDEDLQSVYKYAHDISTGAFRNFNVGLLHGKMSPDEKDFIMQQFKDGFLNVLVSTTVIEVGVDVPNASIILIENADRFGLSQLHQLRGRVGRGSRKSTCILVTDNINDDTKKRLKIMCSTTDGFKIAEEDFKLRGCGDFFGQRQHGLPSLKIADLVNDMELLEMAKNTAYNIINDDPMLSKVEHSSLRTEVLRMFANSSSD
ncbi:MAG: ATP-dependent DNA helicase RecG [Ruminococcus sp.]|nr:ATP-dependent DNA helicase RecG [Ruminococcus sp.]